MDYDAMSNKIYSVSHNECMFAVSGKLKMSEVRKLVSEGWRHCRI